MTIVQSDVVDLIGFNEETGKIELAIIDDLFWDGSTSHLQLLQDKVNAYLAFIESGEVFESYPKIKEYNFKIILYMKYQPDKAGIDFIDRLTLFLSQAGYEFQMDFEA